MLSDGFDDARVRGQLDGGLALVSHGGVVQVRQAAEAQGEHLQARRTRPASDSP